MQDIVVEKPYKFIPPHRSALWPTLIRNFDLQGIWMRRNHGVMQYECRGVEKLRHSIDQGHGVLLTPNHSRPCDPIAFGWLCREADCLLYAMASWHLFNQGWFYAWAIHKMGGFSVNREGVDRQAINTAIDIVESAERPLVIFPEGATTRNNDRLNAMLDGVAFIARIAAKRRSRRPEPGQVVVHPVALKYLFGGDLMAAVDPVLTEIETRLTWHPQRDLPLISRIAKIGRALICLKELDYFGEPQSGSTGDRLTRLIDRLLCPLEDEWLGGLHAGGTVPRVKALRMKIIPEMINGRIYQAERQRRWRQLADIYLAQQISGYPPDYLTSRPSVDRLLETVERFEEDLTDKVRVHGSLRVIMVIDEAIEVSPSRDRTAKVDPLMARIEERLQGMLDKLALESPLYEVESQSDR